MFEITVGCFAPVLIALVLLMIVCCCVAALMSGDPSTARALIQLV